MALQVYKMFWVFVFRSDLKDVVDDLSFYIQPLNNQKDRPDDLRPFER